MTTPVLFSTTVLPFMEDVWGCSSAGLCKLDFKDKNQGREGLKEKRRHNMLLGKLSFYLCRNPRAPTPCTPQPADTAPIQWFINYLGAARGERAKTPPQLYIKPTHSWGVALHPQTAKSRATDTQCLTHTKAEKTIKRLRWTSRGGNNKYTSDAFFANSTGKSQFLQEKKKKNTGTNCLFSQRHSPHRQTQQLIAPSPQNPPLTPEDW